MGRTSVTDASIKPVGPSMHICGPAITVATITGDSLMVHAALRIAQPGDVVVVDARRNLDYALWSTMTTKMAKKQQLGGLFD